MIPEPVTPESDPQMSEFLKEQNIRLIHIEINKDTKDKGKKRGIAIDPSQVIQILEFILHANNNPTLICCNNGGQLTSLVIACFRKLQFWSSVSIFNEFVNYSTMINHNDRLFIENFKAKFRLPNQKERVPWIWNGMSANIIENHFSITLSDDKDKDKAAITAQL
ncbi:unnamed protein product [Ambrosiozyma monospora]|uniref:Unnamed protein product n=1 Tax=Ambrosiozyma monospora TaxID=43982 RepID=A0A9W6YT53_AMBMO|nr:unnamed protein product [Ambrosiozyma monospora]